MPHAALWVVQHTQYLFSYFPLTSFNAARGFVGGATTPSQPIACSLLSFNAARGFVGGATKDA